ncbi:hypothetical protein STEG23_011008 [Scotinomys teguina]
MKRRRCRGYRLHKKSHLSLDMYRFKCTDLWLNLVLMVYLDWPVSSWKLLLSTSWSVNLGYWCLTLHLDFHKSAGV